MKKINSVFDLDNLSFSSYETEESDPAPLPLEIHEESIVLNYDVKENTCLEASFQFNPKIIASLKTLSLKFSTDLVTNTSTGATDEAIMLRIEFISLKEDEEVRTREYDIMLSPDDDLNEEILTYSPRGDLVSDAVNITVWGKMPAGDFNTYKKASITLEIQEVS